MSGSINLGRVRPKYVGDYDPDRAYDVLERVKYQGQIYECAVRTTAGMTPDSAENGSAYWTQISLNSPAPQAVWDGTELYFEYPDGETTEHVDLKGPKGDTGEDGQVTLTSDLTSTAPDVALSALGGKRLKDEIDKLSREGSGKFTAVVEAMPVGAELESLKESMADGGFLYVKDEDEGAGGGCKGGGGWNTEEILTESGEWVAPVTGWYEVISINGGQGGFASINKDYAISGNSGVLYRGLVKFARGEKVQVTIGAGGVGVISNDTSSADAQRLGGKTSFGDFSLKLYGYFCGHLAYRISNGLAINCEGGGRGGGVGGSYNKVPNALWYGGGGGSYIFTDSVINAGNGYQGVVILRFYNPDKDNDPTTENE